jgi:hypothetical protein
VSLSIPIEALIVIAILAFLVWGAFVYWIGYTTGVQTERIRSDK